MWKEERGKSLLHTTSLCTLRKLYVWRDESSCLKASVNKGKFSSVIILDPFIISSKPRGLQSRYSFCFYSYLPQSIPTKLVSLFPGVVYIMSGLSKMFSIRSSSPSLDSFFLLPGLLRTAILIMNFLARVQITSVFVCGLEGSDLSVLWTLRLKFRFVENAEDVVDAVSEGDAAVLTCNCCDIFFLTVFSDAGSFFFLNPFYLFGSSFFFFLFQFFFLGASLTLYRSAFFSL